MTVTSQTGRIIATTHLRVRRAQQVIAVILLSWGIFFVLSLLRTRTLGDDFAIFYGAAKATAAGQSPYDWATQAFWANHLLSSLPLLHITLGAFVTPPPFAKILAPITVVPLYTAYLLWVAVSYGGIVLALFALVSWAGYRRRLPLALLLSCAPSATFGLLVGQDSWLVLCALVVALVLAERSPLWAGSLLVVLAFPKPHLLIPLALLLLLAYPTQRRHLGKGLTIGVLIWLVAAIVLGGPSSIPAWLHDMATFQSTISGQPDVISLAGLYMPITSAHLLPVLDAMLALAGAIALFVMRPRSGEGPAGSRRFLSLGIPIVLLTAPYAHTHDTIILAVPLLLLIGPHGRGLLRPPVLIATIVALIMPMAFWTPWHALPVSTLPTLAILLTALGTRITSFDVDYPPSERVCSPRGVANAPTRSRGATKVATDRL